LARPLPLDLFVEVTASDGTKYRWDANQLPGSRPQNLSFRTKIGEGFSDASLQLARRIDLDYPDLNLVDSIAITGADGSIAYEGFVAAQPRSLSDTHSIGVTLAGWMASAKFRTFQEIYVDRDASQWGDMPIERKAANLGAGVSMGDFSYNAGQGGLVCALPNQALGIQTIAERGTARRRAARRRIGYQGKTTSLPVGWVQRFVAGDVRTGGTDNYADARQHAPVVRAVARRRYIAHWTTATGRPRPRRPARACSFASSRCTAATA
jgi:hypothetical protein